MHPALTFEVQEAVVQARLIDAASMRRMRIPRWGRPLEPAARPPVRRPLGALVARLGLL
jgi:hypothetical protein